MPLIERAAVAVPPPASAGSKIHFAANYTAMRNLITNRATNGIQTGDLIWCAVPFTVREVTGAQATTSALTERVKAAVVYPVSETNPLTHSPTGVPTDSEIGDQSIAYNAAGDFWHSNQGSWQPTKINDRWTLLKSTTAGETPDATYAATFLGSQGYPPGGGMVVYNVPDKKAYVYDGTAWLPFPPV